MKKPTAKLRKLVLHRDTLRALAPIELRALGGGGADGGGSAGEACTALAGMPSQVPGVNTCAAA